MSNIPPVDLSAMNRTFFEGLDSGARLELLCRLHAMTVELAERLAQNSTNSSKPPSSDSPFGGASCRGGGGIGQKDAAKTSPGIKPWTPPSSPPRKPGKQPGAKGNWRCEALSAERTQNHYPNVCGACGAGLELWHATTRDSGHFVLDLERLPSGLRVACVLHLYHRVRCPCGAETAAHAAKGLVFAVEGRKRDLRPSEASLVGPALATFIAALSVRYRLSRAKIAELLATWLDVRLSVGSIDRCIREVGLACAPIVEGLIEDLRRCGVINADETPWPQRGRLRWLWVALSSTTAVFKIASRRAEEIRDLIGEAFLGWLVSDGYAVYRGYARRQRCLAHLIRKGIALIEGCDYRAARFGGWLVRELRGLIHAVAEQDAAHALNPILARLKRACLLNEDADAAKARALAREILNDWDAITAFVANPELPPTNNDAETALRHAVIARRISFGTRTDEGSRAYAAILSVTETCRRRKIDAWAFVTNAVATARRGQKPEILPAPA
jgi:transposase